MRVRAWSLTVLLLLGSGCIDDRHYGRTDDRDDGPGTAATAWHWVSAPQPIVPRGEAACAGDTGRLLIVGGFTEGERGGTVTASAELFELAEGSWSRAPDLPVALHHTATAFADGRFFVLGGYVTSQFVPTELVWSWAPGEVAWTREEPLPAARGAHGAAVVEDRIHMVGGVGRTGLITKVHVYDIGARAWSEGPTLPLAREHLAVGAHDGTLYVAAGRAGAFDSDIGRFDVLDPDATAWTEGPALPTPRGGAAGSAGPHGFVVVGGEGNGGTFEEVERYVYHTDTWETLSPDPTPRHGSCVAWMDDGLHVVTGGHEPGFTWSTTHSVLMPSASDAT